MKNPEVLTPKRSSKVQAKGWHASGTGRSKYESETRGRSGTVWKSGGLTGVEHEQRVPSLGATH